jgi:hypothetical protein
MSEGAAVGVLDRPLGDEDSRRDLGRAALRQFETSLKWDRNARQTIDSLAQAIGGQSTAGLLPCDEGGR